MKGLKYSNIFSDQKIQDDQDTKNTIHSKSNFKLLFPNQKSVFPQENFYMN